MKKLLLLLLAALLPIASIHCQKMKGSSSTDLVISGETKENFSKVISALQDLGYTVTDFDATAKKIVVDWREIPLEDLKNAASLSGPLDAYDKGRYQLRADVSDDPSGTKILIQLEVQGFLTPQQRSSQDFGSTNKWRKENSTGWLEKNIIEQLKTQLASS